MDTSLPIAFGADHAGVGLKDLLRDAQTAPVLDLGTHGPESVDYPAFGAAVADAVASGRACFGVVVCGSGIGISIAANRNTTSPARDWRASTMTPISSPSAPA
jgi:ribose 5-phosphate isomerase B